jgi:hypothetical protein
MSAPDFETPLAKLRAAFSASEECDCPDPSAHSMCLANLRDAVEEFLVPATPPEGEVVTWQGDRRGEEASSAPTPSGADGAELPYVRQLRARLEAMDKVELVRHALAQEERIASLQWMLEYDGRDDHPGLYDVEEMVRNHLPADVLAAGRSYDRLEPLTRIAGQPVTVGTLLQALRGQL